MELIKHIPRGDIKLGKTYLVVDTYLISKADNINNGDVVMVTKDCSDDLKLSVPGTGEEEHTYYQEAFYGEKWGLRYII